MKRVVQLTMITLSLLAFSLNQSIAQSSVQNQTSCDFTVHVNMGTANCLGVLANTVTYNVPANSSFFIPGPLVIAKASGSPNPSPIGCDFSISKTCTGPVGAVVVNCSTPCGNRYIVTLQNNNLIIRP